MRNISERRKNTTGGGGGGRTFTLKEPLLGFSIWIPVLPLRSLLVRRNKTISDQGARFWISEGQTQRIHFHLTLFYGVRVLWGLTPEPWPLYTLVTGRNLGQNQAKAVVVGILPLIQRNLFSCRRVL